MRFVSVAQPSILSAIIICSLSAMVIEFGVLAQPACGQDRPTSPPRSGPQAAMPEVLPHEAAELEIALGRMRLVPDRFRIVRKHEQFDWPGDAATASAAKACSRSMQVAALDGRPTVKLTYADPKEKWNLSVDSVVGAEWTRELLDRTPTLKIAYVQRPHQPITVTIDGVSKQPIKLSSLTLWHLTEQKSPEFEQYVLPALVRLNPTWDLPQALAAAKRMRGYGELGNSSAAKHQLAQSIAELDSTDRRIREAAKQKLREEGLAAQIPLEKLRGGPLSSQQRSTVEELLGELEPRSADTPTRLAYWLSGDPNWR